MEFMPSISLSGNAHEGSILRRHTSCASVTGTCGSGLISGNPYLAPKKHHAATKDNVLD